MNHKQLSPQARDRAQEPRNDGPIERWDGRARITGPCGDTMSIPPYASRAAARVFVVVAAQILEPELQPWGRKETP